MAEENGASRRQILKLTEEVGILKGNVASLAQNQADGFKRLEKRIDVVIGNQGGAIRDLDKRQDEFGEELKYMKGKAAGIGLIFGLITTVAGLLIAYFN